MYNSSRVKTGSNMTGEPTPIGAMAPDLVSAWKVTTLYEKCIRSDMTSEEAKNAMIEIAPDGNKQYLVDIWFMGMENVREHIRGIEDQIEEDGVAFAIA